MNELTEEQAKQVRKGALIGAPLGYAVPVAFAVFVVVGLFNTPAAILAALLLGAVVYRFFRRRLPRE